MPRGGRIVKSVSTVDFIGNWSVGENSFAVNAPNAVLVIGETEGAQQDVTIIELFTAIYDSDKQTLKYYVPPDNIKSTDLPSLDSQH
ncbi:MAG: hypothetical protein ACPKQO_03595 [Nitrososphaeraceae archaeon]